MAIVGGGAAGLAAGTLLGRCLLRTVLYDDDAPRNVGSRAVHSFLTRDGIDPAELRRLGREEAERYGAELRSETVCSIEAIESGFEVATGGGCVRVERVLLATGASDHVPSLPGLRDLYGISVHQCPFCDGWEKRGGALACHGSGDDGAEAALGLLTWSRDVILFLDGGAMPGASARAALARHGVGLVTEPIEELVGRDGQLEAIVLKDGRRMSRDALFLKDGQRAKNDIARGLGCELDECQGRVVADRQGRTSVPGVYVAGDVLASGAAQTVIGAAADGIRAAHAIACDARRDRYAFERGSK